jgi:DNA-binding NarL/FixJ family response regulator
MDPDLENVIRQALGDALAAGKDHLSQTELAVRAVQRARPDVTASDALAAGIREYMLKPIRSDDFVRAVRRVLDSDAPEGGESHGTGPGDR